jgi:hypothetical protein
MMDFTFDLSRFRPEQPRDVIRSAAAAGLYVYAEKVMTEAKERCPVDTGRLRATGHVQPPEIGASEISVTLAFGTDYAIYVHENLAARHPVGEAKFLERAVMANAAGMASFLARSIAQRTRA